MEDRDKWNRRLKRARWNYEVGFLKGVSFEQVCKVRKGLGEKRRHITPAFRQETLLQPLKHEFDVLVIHILMHTKMDI